jgi:hypothetical protein
MATYRTGTESAATLHCRPPKTIAAGQERALNALLTRCYGRGALVEIEVVRGWAEIVANWPAAVGQQDDPPQPSV